MRKSFNYDVIQIGEVLGQKDVRITDELIRTCAQTLVPILSSQPSHH